MLSRNDFSAGTVIPRSAVGSYPTPTANARDDIAIDVLEAAMARQTAVAGDHIIRVAQVGADAFVAGTVQIARTGTKTELVTLSPHTFLAHAGPGGTRGCILATFIVFAAGLRLIQQAVTHLRPGTITAGPPLRAVFVLAAGVHGVAGTIAGLVFRGVFDASLWRRTEGSRRGYDDNFVACEAKRTRLLLTTVHSTKAGGATGVTGVGQTVIRRLTAIVAGHTAGTAGAIRPPVIKDTFALFQITDFPKSTQIIGRANAGFTHADLAPQTTTDAALPEQAISVVTTAWRTA